MFVSENTDIETLREQLIKKREVAHSCRAKAEAARKKDQYSYNDDELLHPQTCLLIEAAEQAEAKAEAAEQAYRRAQQAQTATNPSAAADWADQLLWELQQREETEQ